MQGVVGKTHTEVERKLAEAGDDVEMFISPACRWRADSCIISDRIGVWEAPWTSSGVLVDAGTQTVMPELLQNTTVACMGPRIFKVSDRIEDEMRIMYRELQDAKRKAVLDVAAQAEAENIHTRTLTKEEWAVQVSQWTWEETQDFLVARGSKADLPEMVDQPTHFWQREQVPDNIRRMEATMAVASYAMRTGVDVPGARTASWIRPKQAAGSTSRDSPAGRAVSRSRSPRVSPTAVAVPTVVEVMAQAEAVRRQDDVVVESRAVTEADTASAAATNVAGFGTLWQTMDMGTGMQQASKDGAAAACATAAANSPGGFGPLWSEDTEDDGPAVVQTLAAHAAGSQSAGSVAGEVPSSRWTAGREDPEGPPSSAAPHVQDAAGGIAASPLEGEGRGAGVQGVREGEGDELSARALRVTRAAAEAVEQANASQVLVQVGVHEGAHSRLGGDSPKSEQATAVVPPASPHTRHYEEWDRTDKNEVSGTDGQVGDGTGSWASQEWDEDRSWWGGSVHTPRSKRQEQREASSAAWSGAGVGATAEGSPERVGRSRSPNAQKWQEAARGQVRGSAWEERNVANKAETHYGRKIMAIIRHGGSQDASGVRHYRGWLVQKCVPGLEDLVEHWVALQNLASVAGLPAKRKLLSYLVMHEETQNPKMRPVVRHVVLGEVRGDRTLRTFIGAYKTDYTCTAETIQDFRRPYVQMVDDNAYPKVRASFRLEQEDYLSVFDHLGRPETPWTPQFKTLPGGGSGQVAKVVYIHRDTGEVFEGRPPIC